MIVKEKVLNSVIPVIKNSKFVKINNSKIKTFAKELLPLEVPPWNNNLQFIGKEEETIQYYFFLDSINFCFWPEKGKQKWEYENLTGYYAYSYAIKKAIENNPLLINTKYLSEIEYKDFIKIFQGKGNLQLLKERYKIIKENFSILHKLFQGKASNLVKKSNQNVNTLVELILKHFPSFKDINIYEEKKVYFLKRAQIFISDISYALENKGLGYFSNLDDLSIFADYKLPQILHAQKIIYYEKGLLNKILNEELFPAGSEEEIEIRANTIYACELITEEINKLGRKINNNEIDWILWVNAKQTSFSLPHHKTLTIFY